MRFEKSATRGTGPGRREYKTVQFELEKYDEEQGIVSGYASVFGNVDDGGDVVEPGAFAETIAEGVGRVKILALHNDCWLPVGRPLVLKEDTKGLNQRHRSWAGCEDPDPRRRPHRILHWL